jgi:hypothetical protein
VPARNFASSFVAKQRKLVEAERAVYWPKSVEVLRRNRKQHFGLVRRGEQRLREHGAIRVKRKQKSPFDYLAHGNAQFTKWVVSKN